MPPPLWPKLPQSSGSPGPTGPAGPAGSNTIQAQNQGAPLPGTFSTINFTGAGVTAVDGGGGLLTVTIAGGGTGSNLGLVYAMGTTNTFMP